MFKRGGKLYSVLHSTCPRCHRGKLFVGGFSYRFSEITNMHESCPHCKLKYEREPGFFYGAMYVSYGLTVALWVSLAVASYVLFGTINPWIYLPVGITLLFALLPGIYRLSRSIWLTMFVPYEAEYDKEIPKID